MTYSFWQANVVFNDRILPLARQEGWISLGEQHGKCGAVCFFQDEPIMGADAATFSAVNACYAMDHARLYYRGRPVDHVDIASVDVLSTVFARDIDHVYAGWQRLPGADPGDLDLLPRENTEEPSCFLRSAQAVFFQNRVLSHAEPDSFRVLNQNFGWDETRLYYQDQLLVNVDTKPRVLEEHYCVAGEHAFFQMNVLPGVDTQTLSVIADEWAKDSRQVFFREDRTELDAESVEILHRFQLHQNHYFLKDRNGVYLDETIIEGADPETFKVVTDDLSRDARHVFYEDELIPAADAASFAHLTGNYFRDKRHVFYQDRVLRKLNPEQVHLYPEEFAKDETWVYYEDGLVKAAAADDFTPVPESGYAVSQAKLYYEQKLCSVVPGETRSLGFGFLVTGDDVVFAGKPIAGADSATFECLWLSDYGGYLKDQHRCFFVDFETEKVKVLAGANPASFEPLSEQFAKDDRFVFFTAGKINGADPVTFRVVPEILAHRLNQSEYGMDAKRVFLRNMPLPGADPDSFQALSEDIAFDRFHAFIEGSQADLAVLQQFPYFQDLAELQQFPFFQEEGER